MKARQIGNNFERRVATMFRRWWPLACRGVQFKGGIEAPDVMLTPTNPPYYVECKYRTKPVGEITFSRWYERAVEDCKLWAGRYNDGKAPPVLIVYRWRRKPIQVLLSDGYSHVPWVEFRRAMDEKMQRK